MINIGYSPPIIDNVVKPVLTIPQLVSPQQILADEVARLANNGNPHDISRPVNPFQLDVPTGLQLPDGVRELAIGVVASTSPGNVLAILSYIVWTGTLSFHVVTGGAQVPVGLYVFENVILRHVESGIDSEPFTIRFNLLP
ncbi:MAG: hypothetical protein FWC95_00700 [Defluviitaleaceae bacterium]|nr:hypothetical protein [Defluviitaleaceae bacterium]